MLGLQIHFEMKNKIGLKVDLAIEAGFKSFKWFEVRPGFTFIEFKLRIKYLNQIQLIHFEIKYKA